ncbi:hypothetical protein [Paenibacillus illinoisensis]|uniref:Uncharacterized protein n=1 Tax=Paenibacillus illinoisensis TaxID=59845 RepID=A0A2W0CIW8_9BACL|nr:hypothetical protein [Paenibacillus illinoisensis]PYY28265.1 hypothetical protein PIL02S_03411 [Paenibacillus illinoisensis]
MKAKVIGLVKKKQYYMGCNKQLVSWSPFTITNENEINELAYDKKNIDRGKLSFKWSDHEEVTLSERCHFAKLLEVNDDIVLGAQTYIINKVKYIEDGSVIYYVEIEIDDEKSKKEAEIQLALREAYLKGVATWEKHVNELQVKCDELKLENYEMKNKKKADEQKRNRFLIWKNKRGMKLSHE